ncbi:dystroglycan 1-like isoform X4 [Lepisosteus oculatus]|uniref:dystroglycan 1-like isoform X4 n=1 Tax=Lepisosteus oculatus TaxID=7918 RepID=UPI00371CC396
MCMRSVCGRLLHHLCLCGCSSSRFLHMRGGGLMASLRPFRAPLSSLRPLLLETFFWSCLMCSHITVGPHSCNSVRVFRGIPDKEVNAGTVFFHPIPPVAFHGPVKDYEVSLAGTIDKLPRWLDYNPQTQSLQGLAVSEERGDYTIAVTAVGHCRQEPSPSTHFHLHVLNGTHSLKARSLRRLDWRNKHTKSSQGCPAGETVTYSAIILQADVFSLSAGRRLLLVSTMGEYLRLDPFSLKLRSFRSPSELQLENSTLLTEDTGIGDSPDTHAAVEVYWPVGCGDFQMVSELVRVLRYSKDSGHLSHLLGLHLTGWRVFTWGGGGSQHRRRERRQLINTPTPVMTPVAPTYVSATLPIKLSYSYMGMTTISTYVRDTEIINNEGYPTGISTSMGSTTRSSEDKKKDVSSALKSELTRPNEEFSTMYLRLCPSGLFTPDYLAEDLKISTTDTGHMTIATRIMVGQSQETSLLSQMSPLQTSSQTIQSYYSPAVLCSVFLAYSSDLNLMGLESQHVKSISLQTVLSRSETSELVIEPEFSSTGTHIKLTSKPFIDLLTPPAEDSWPMLHSEDVATTSYQVMLGKSTMSTSSVQQSWHTAAFQMQRTSVLSSTSSTVSVVLVAAPGTPMTQVYYTDTDSISLFPTLTRKDAPESILMAPDSENLFKRTSTIPTKSAQSHQDTETIDIPNISPFVLRPIKPLIATIGLLFEFSIPADTFSDPEDGTADNLTMKIRPSDGSPSGPESWLTLDHKQRLLSGYPLDSDMLFSPQELLLIARDSGGLSAELPFTIELRHPLSEPCHTYTIRTMNSFHSFVKDRRKIELFLDKMAKYFNDTGSSHISVSTLQPGSTVVSWHNVTLCQEDKKAQSLCPKHKIQGLLSAMQTLEGDVEPSFAQAMLPEFRIRSVGNVTYGGMCLRGSDLEYPSPTGAIAHSDRYRWIPTLVIALLTVLGLFLSLVLMAAIFRSCKACECIIRSESISLWPSDRPSCSSCHLELDTLKPRKPPLFLQNIPPPPQQLWVNLSHPPQERLHRRPLTHTQRPYQRSTVPSQSPPRYQLPPPYVLKDQPPQRNSSQ